MNVLTFIMTGCKAFEKIQQLPTTNAAPGMTGLSAWRGIPVMESSALDGNGIVFRYVDDVTHAESFRIGTLDLAAMEDGQ